MLLGRHSNKDGAAAETKAGKAALCCKILTEADALDLVQKDALDVGAVGKADLVANVRDIIGNVEHAIDHASIGAVLKLLWPTLQSGPLGLDGSLEDRLREPAAREQERGAES